MELGPLGAGDGVESRHRSGRITALPYTGFCAFGQGT